MLQYYRTYLKDLDGAKFKIGDEVKPVGKSHHGVHFPSSYTFVVGAVLRGGTGNSLFYYAPAKEDPLRYFNEGDWIKEERLIPAMVYDDESWI